MKKVLYIGNKLSGHGLNKTTVETLGEDLSREGYTVITVSHRKNFLLRLLHMSWATLTCVKVDFILIDTYSTSAFWYAFVCSQIARLRKIPYIPILHGGNLPNRLQNNSRLCRAIFAHAYQNVAPSHYLKSEFETYGYTNVTYIPNTLELEKYPFKLRKQVTLKLLWVRAFASIYNPSMAVKVLAKLKATYPNASLTMVGPDKDGSLELTQLLAQELNVAVTFTGRLSKADWWQLSKEHDVFINTTHFDNTPVSVMEAMALGLPVVSTNVGGIPYLVENGSTALLVNDNDVSAMVSQLKMLEEHPLLSEQLSTSGRQLAETWDWQKVKVLWFELLK